MARCPTNRPRYLLATLLCVLLPVLMAGSGFSLQAELERASEIGQVPADLVVTYAAMHPLYGGTVVEIRGDGLAQRTTRRRGGRQAEIRQTTVTQADLLQLMDLLVDERAWEQRVPDRRAVPDEGKAVLDIQLGEAEGGFWEWYNDMGERDRLLRISALMSELVPR